MVFAETEGPIGQQAGDQGLVSECVLPSVSQAGQSHPGSGCDLAQLPTKWLTFHTRKLSLERDLTTNWYSRNWLSVTAVYGTNRTAAVLTRIPSNAGNYFWTAVSEFCILAEYTRFTRRDSRKHRETPRYSPRDCTRAFLNSFSVSPESWLDFWRSQSAFSVAPRTVRVLVLFVRTGARNNGSVNNFRWKIMMSSQLAIWTNRNAITGDHS